MRHDASVMKNKERPTGASGISAEPLLYGVADIQRLTGSGKRQIQERTRLGLIPGTIRLADGTLPKPFRYARAVVDAWLRGEQSPPPLSKKGPSK